MQQLQLGNTHRLFYQPYFKAFQSPSEVNRRGKNVERTFDQFYRLLRLERLCHVEITNHFIALRATKAAETDFCMLSIY